MFRSMPKSQQREVYLGYRVPAKRYIEKMIKQKRGKELREALTVKAIAAALDTTPIVLQESFYQAQGAPLDEYVSQRLMVRACQLLVRTDCTVKEIAARLGLARHDGFTGMFRRHMKCSPSEFRKLSRL